MAAFEAAYDKILETFKLNSLRSIQREALEKLVSGEDVFVIQPTGSGKSLIFQAAPIVFDVVKPTDWCNNARMHSEIRWHAPFKPVCRS